MNCFECTVNIRENHGTCNDIFSLLNILGIPLQEQVILWNMALEKISCKRFKDILLILMKKQGIYNIDLPADI